MCFSPTAMITTMYHTTIIIATKFPISASNLHNTNYIIWIMAHVFPPWMGRLILSVWEWNCLIKISLALPLCHHSLSNFYYTHHVLWLFFFLLLIGSFSVNVVFGKSWERDKFCLAGFIFLINIDCLICFLRLTMC